MRRVVVLCAHQGARFIESQLRSILNQTSAVDAILVFDFASTDGTRARVLQVASGASIPLELITHDDAPGAAASFFRAFDHVASRVEDQDCVFLADQDDVWLPDKVERVTETYVRARDEGATDLLVFHDVTVTDASLHPVRATYYTGDPFRIPRDLAPDRVLLANPVIGHTMAVSGSLLKRTQRAASPKRYLMHDWALLLFASRCGEIRFVPASLSLYRQHAANVIGAYRSRPWSQRLRRTWTFAGGVVGQALAFAGDRWRHDPGSRRSSLDAALAWADRFARPVGFLLLGLCALQRGPTWRRRLLGVVLIARMVAMPARPADRASPGRFAAP
jgi:glycosyltransferase involved in cell wall biosynthesis